jgi:hypothetical protein
MLKMERVFCGWYANAQKYKAIRKEGALLLELWEIYTIDEGY